MLKDDERSAIVKLLDLMITSSLHSEGLRMLDALIYNYILMWCTLQALKLLARLNHGPVMMSVVW
jgi:hypothetical protein